jgi:colicin import membrane protein
MTAPPLQRFTLLSFLIHILFFGLAVLAMDRASRFRMPQSYVVNLVGIESLSVPGSAKVLERAQVSEKKPAAGPQVSEKKPAAAPSAPQHKETHETKKRQVLERMNSDRMSLEKSRKTEEKYLSERIAAIGAKKEIERIVKLRNIISLKGSGEGSAEQSAQVKGQEKSQVSEGGAAGGERSGSAMNAYFALITRQIRQHWVYPDPGGKNLEAIISIRIFKNGSVQVQGIEKGSGNSIFDRSALRAIEKASPLTPPPYEIDMGVRFYP